MSRADRSSGKVLGRGRGRPPHRMLGEATAIAMKRGFVIPVPGGRSDSFDIIVCEEFRNVFVRFRYSGAAYITSQEVLRQYHRDIGRISRMPQTTVTAWEFWLRMSRGRWQFFLVMHDGIVEVREDGSILYRPVLPVPVADTMKEEAGPAADEDRPGEEPGGGV
jgi:hypothetical protein